MHVSNAWGFLYHGVRGRCSIALFLAPTWTLFTFVPFNFQNKSHAIYFGNEMRGNKMYRLWLLKLCNLHKFFYLSVSVQLIWEGKSFTSRSKKLNFHWNDAHHPVFEQSIFAEKRYYCRRDARDSTIAESTSLEDMIPFTRATFATENEVLFFVLERTQVWHPLGFTDDTTLPHPRQWWTCQHPIQAENWWLAEWVFAGWREQKSWKSSVG